MFIFKRFYSFSSRNSILKILAGEKQDYIIALDKLITANNATDHKTYEQSVSSFANLGMLDETSRLTSLFHSKYSLIPKVEHLNLILGTYTSQYFNRLGIPKEHLMGSYETMSLNGSDPDLDNIFSLIKVFRYKYKVYMNEQTLNILINVLASMKKYDLLEQFNEFYAAGKIKPSVHSFAVYLDFYYTARMLDDIERLLSQYEKVKIFPTLEQAKKIVMLFGRFSSASKLESIIHFMNANGIKVDNNVVKQAFLIENEHKDIATIQKYLDKIVNK